MKKLLVLVLSVSILAFSSTISAGGTRDSSDRYLLNDDFIKRSFSEMNVKLEHIWMNYIIIMVSTVSMKAKIDKAVAVDLEKLGINVEEFINAILIERLKILLAVIEKAVKENDEEKLKLIEKIFGKDMCSEESIKLMKQKILKI